MSAAMAQRPNATEPYDVNEAYEIYNVLLHHDQHYALAKRMVIIQEETVSGVRHEGPLPCLTNEASEEFKDAIADYEQVNTRRWVLQRKFTIEKPYELVSSDTIRILFEASKDGTIDFAKRYPDSGSYVFVMSAVGFNEDKTKAIVYSGSHCPGTCGTWSIHLMQKVDGKWKEVPVSSA